MKELDEFLAAERTAPKTFHPVHERGDAAWYPGNEAASLLIQCGHIWEDITVLAQLYKVSTAPYVKKLVLKYALVELRSLVDVFDQLAAKAMDAGVFDPAERQGWREITRQERDTAKKLLATYSAARKRTVTMVIDIRNNIGAHRGNLNWQDTMKFWDAITPELLAPLLTSIPPAFGFLKDLDLYEWNRTPEPGTIAFIGGQLRPEYFE